MILYNPAALAFALSVPLIILLYLLKQKYQEKTVSSLYLWHAVYKDLEASAPWQKLRKNLLMILQIAAALLLVLALADPYLKSAGGQPRQVIIALDASLSMQANDLKPSRFEWAKKRAKELVSNLQPEAVVTLIRAGKTPVIEENLSNDRNRVLQKIDAMEAGYGTAGLDEAVSLVESIKRQYPDSEAVVFTDTRPSNPAEGIRYVEASANADNYAVVLLSHTVSKEDITALSRIANYGSTGSEITLSLYTDGKVFDARKVKIAGGETANIYWEGIPLGTQVLLCRIDETDALKADNAAWDCIKPSRTNRVLLVSAQNIFIEKVVSLIGGTELFKGSTEETIQPEGYDLYIFDGYLPEKLPPSGSILLFNPPPNDIFDAGKIVEAPRAEKSGHSLFKFVEDYSFFLSKSRIFEAPIWAEEVLPSDQGTLAFAGQYGKNRLLVFGFDLHDTDLTLSPSFPIMMASAMEWLLPSAVNLDGSYFIDSEVEFALNPVTEKASVHIPDGRTVEVAPPFPPGAFMDTAVPGVYELVQTDGTHLVKSSFAVNVPSQVESNLKTASGTGQNGQETRETVSHTVSTGLKLKGILLMVLLLILAVEWGAYCYVA